MVQTLRQAAQAVSKEAARSGAESGRQHLAQVKGKGKKKRTSPAQIVGGWPGLHRCSKALHSQPYAGLASDSGIARKHRLDGAARVCAQGHHFFWRACRHNLSATGAAFGA